MGDANGGARSEDSQEGATLLYTELENLQTKLLENKISFRLYTTPHRTMSNSQYLILIIDFDPDIVR